ncbi:hypothetical protein K435DRAFT_516775 [Dendrothele bispora CBS 962.96]|uniref:Uncharacterized protein n=1 Tax=Dendrothele bispora (strain CBS 962.96) TaxID=1314807 RepID=A0A4S8MAC7_DENBC|nr:hypothetical protein K435DRAFT_516775 [Dendrothele bispora CBS 962.96]
MKNKVDLTDSAKVTYLSKSPKPYMHIGLLTFSLLCLFPSASRARDAMILWSR